MEQVPEGIPGLVREYLFRQLNKLEQAVQNASQLPKLTAIPAKPSIGKIYYFSNVILPSITAEGAYEYTTLGWRALGNQPSVVSYAPGLSTIRRSSQPIGNTTGATQIGRSSSVLSGGTVVARTPSNVNMLSILPRVAIVSTAAIGAMSAAHDAASDAINCYPTPSLPYRQRLVAKALVGVSDAVINTSARMFIGLSQGSTAATNVEPSTLTNSLGFAQLASDSSQWFFVYGGSVAQAPIPLGTALGAPDTVGVPWGLTIDIAATPGETGATLTYSILNASSGAVVSGSILDNGDATVLPISSTTLGQRRWRSANTIALAVALDVGIYSLDTILG